MQVINKLSDWYKILHSKDALETQGIHLILLVGIWLCLDHLFSRYPVFTVMASIGTEKQWGLIFICIGLLQVYGLVCNNLRIRRALLLLKGGMWSTF